MESLVPKHFCPAESSLNLLKHPHEVSLAPPPTSASTIPPLMQFMKLTNRSLSPQPQGGPVLADGN